MYSIFEKTLLTDQGKHIVISHENDSDAQTFCKDILNCHTNSVEVLLVDSSQLSYLNIARVNERKGLYESFILHWKGKIQIYEAKKPCAVKWLDNMKTIMLENSVVLHFYLKQVEYMAKQLKKHIGDTLSYDNYQ